MVVKYFGSYARGVHSNTAGMKMHIAAGYAGAPAANLIVEVSAPQGINNSQNCQLRSISR
jgi:hypothetical protein